MNDKKSFLEELDDVLRESLVECEKEYGKKATKQEMTLILLVFSFILAAIGTGFFMLFQYFFIG
jgi:hypothetical protein